jgi:capsular exopolysaccharide synthesis family protein
MDSNAQHINNDEVDIKEIFWIINRYKWMIIFLVILFGLGSAYYAYFKPNIYKATATVEVGLSQRGYVPQDILSMATDSGRVIPDTEMEIIKSRFVAKIASKSVDRTHHYYTTVKYKNIELYKDSPFRVGMNKGFGIKFDLYPIDDKQYRLVVEKAKDSNQTEWSYDKILPYDKEVITPHFHLNILPVKKFTHEKYSFVIDDPKSITPGNVSVRQTSKYSSVLAISFEDNVALRAKEYVNALAHAYIQQNIDKKTKEASKKLDFIDKQLKYITQNLRSSAIKIEDFKKKSKTVSLSTKAETIIKQISEKDAKLSEISMKEEMLSNLYKSVKKGRRLESLVLVGLDKQDSSLVNMIKKLQDAILKKKLLREDYTEMYPEVRKLSKTIAQLKRMIISTIKNMKRGIKEQKILLQKEISKKQKLLNKLPADERMYGQLQRKFAVNEKIYSYLLEKRSATAIIKASTVSKNRIIDEALLPTNPIKPRRTLIVIIGVLFGLIFGIILAFIRNYLDDTIKNEEDITHYTQVPIVGLIPHIKEDADKIAVLTSPKSAVAESLRNLRTNLQFMVSYRGAQVIALTSTISGEGKTTLAVNLGAIMSIANKKTIILNLDMRKPTLHNKFEIPNNHGMSSLLAGNVTLQEVIQNTKYNNLDVITSGPIPPNPSELIQGPFTEKVLSQLKEMYDVVILDTPPIGLVTDARTLMHYADMSLYVIRENYSRKDFIKSVNYLASLNEINSLGIILNDFKINKGGYGYGYGYGYYEDDK